MPRQLRLLTSVFVSGAVVMALELLGSRLLAPVFGSSIFVWGSLIGVVLSALGAGYYVGGKLADIKPNFNVLSIVIFIAGLMVLALPAIAPPLFDLVIRLNLGERYAPLLATTLMLGPPSILLGMVSPYAIRLVAESFETLGKASGNLYALSTVGSIVGTFLTVFFLIPLFGVNRIIFVLGVVLLVVAFLGLNYRFKFLVLLILIILPFAAPYMVNRQLTIATYTLALGDTIFETDTPYHHLVVADAYDPSTQSTTRYLIMDDNLHSAMDLQNPNRTVFPYTDYFHIGLLLNPNITHVLFIGGGGFTGPKAFLRDYPNIAVDVAEIDPEVVQVAEQYFAVNASNPRLHIYVDDGRVFLQSAKQRYDLIVLDAYSRSYVPFQLMTLEFFKLIDAHLTSRGIVISNLISGTTSGDDQLLTAETTTMNQVFPNVYTFAVQDPSDTNPQNVIIIATLAANHLGAGNFEQLASTSTIVKVPGMNDYLANYFTPIGNNSPILTDNYAPVDTMLSPISGLPITNDQPPLLSEQEALQILAGFVVVAAAALILMKKRYL